MLVNLSLSLSKNFLNSSRYGFSNLGSITNKLKQIAQSEIDHEVKNPSDYQTQQKYFKTQGWNVKYTETLIELEKKQGKHLINVLFNARAPLPVEEDENAQAAQQDDQMNEDISQVTVCIKTEGATKWLVANYAVTDDYSEIEGIQFMKQISQEKKDLVSGNSADSGNYRGPEIHTLDHKVQESLKDFVSSFGLNNEFFGKAKDLSFAYEHKFYVQWLKDIHSLV